MSDPRMDKVRDVVMARGMPYATSLSEDIHIFHFDKDGFYEDSPILFVNRNGHQFRLIQQPNGDWLFAGTWNGVFETQEWQTKANLRRPDAAKLIALCGVGPQGTRGAQFEQLSLLPKDTTGGRRRAAYRGHLVEVFFDRGTDKFTLIATATDGNEVRGTFEGKLWESPMATKWCADQFASRQVTYAVKTTRGPLTTAQVAVLEDNPLWGMF